MYLLTFGTLCAHIPPLNTAYKTIFAVPDLGHIVLPCLYWTGPKCLRPSEAAGAPCGEGGADGVLLCEQHRGGRRPRFGRLWPREDRDCRLGRTSW